MGAARLGVLGGTFNPVHFGHLHVARSVRRLFALSEVHLVVAAAPPHKPPESLIALMHRYAMVCLATAREPALIPSLVELEHPASSYSIDTMRKFSRHVAPAGGVLYFVAGADSLLDVRNWRESEKLLTTYNFVFVARPGVDCSGLREILPRRALPRLRDLTGLGIARARRRIAEESAAQGRIYLVDVGAPDISASRVRRRLHERRPVDRMVPKSVRDYIHKFHLYGEQ